MLEMEMEILIEYKLIVLSALKNGTLGEYIYVQVSTTTVMPQK